MREIVNTELGFKAVGYRLTGKEGYNINIINKYIKDFALGLKFLNSLVNLTRINSALSIYLEVYSSIRF